MRIAQPPMAVRGGPLSRRCVFMAVLAERLVITNCLEKRDPTAGCVRRSLCVQNRGVFSTAPPKAVRKTHRRWGGLVKPMGVTGAVRLCQTNCRSPGSTGRGMSEHEAIKPSMEEVFLRLNAEYPAILVTGPRQCGKATMLRRLMSQDGGRREYATLDDMMASYGPLRSRRPPLPTGSSFERSKSSTGRP